jgi:hypothetical protein
VGFLNPQIMISLVGKPDVQVIADAAEQLLRNSCARLAEKVLPAPGV